MKKYRITVNGKSYEVEVEDMGGFMSAATTTQVVQPTATPAPKATPSATPVTKTETKKVEAPTAAPQGAETIESPMPGTVLDIKVKQGDSVTEGQVLLILEAMKMENEIVAPRAGKVAAVNTTSGSAVNAGDALISLE